MTIWLVFGSYLAAVNPLRLRPALPEESGRVRWQPVLLGAALVIAAGAGLVAVSTELLDAIEVTPETYRIAAGTVAALVGMRVVVFPGRAEEPQLNGMWASVVPVAFPLLLTPELIALISIFGATESATRSIGGLLVAIGAGVALGWVAHRRPQLWLAGARLLGAFLVLAGFALVVEGIRDV